MRGNAPLFYVLDSPAVNTAQEGCSSKDEIYSFNLDDDDFIVRMGKSYRWTCWLLAV